MSEESSSCYSDEVGCDSVYSSSDDSDEVPQIKGTRSGSSGGINVRHALEATLQDKTLNLNAAFSFSRTYSDAPNPALELSDLGLVGLPLSSRDAELIKSRSIQAPFGMGERTLVDTTVRDTWEMNAERVSFINPSWDAFVQKALAEVCQALGVNFHASQPRAELYKLLLYETGSHFLPHVDTEKADGMFATIIIVLPSKFDGGAAHLSHNDIPVVYDCSGSSQLDTTVLAWYTDVKHEIKSVTSGYRLALSYNLIHTTQSLRPALVPNKHIGEKLSRILLTWRDGKNTPEKLIYLLDHKYSEANLRASALKGSDAQKVAILGALAKRHGFSLGLANVNCRLSGVGDDEWGRGGFGGRRANANVNFGEIQDRAVSIDHFVDLDGQLISVNLKYDKRSETIPEKLTKTVERGGHDRQEYEGYQGNEAGSLQRWYRRTVLVIWPQRCTCQLLYAGEKGFERACDNLLEDVSPKHSPEQTQLIEFILTNCNSNPERAAEALCVTACELEDIGLWEKAIAACSSHLGIHTIPDVSKHEAIEIFGFEAVRPCLELMLQHDKQNLPRLEFLNSLLGKPWEPRIKTAKKVKELHSRLVKPWAIKQVQETLRTLRKPTIDECSMILKAVRMHGGLHFLSNSMLPGLISTTDSQFLTEFATMVFSDKELPEGRDKNQVVFNLLLRAISLIGHAPGSANKSVKTVAQTCFQLGFPELVGSVIDRAIDVSKLSPTEAQDCARTVMLPLTLFLTERSSTHPEIPPIPQAEVLRMTTMSLYLDWMEKNPNMSNKQDVATLLKLCLVDGDPTLFMTSAVPRLKAMRQIGTTYKDLVDELLRQRSQVMFPEGYTGLSLDSVIFSFAKRYLWSTHFQRPAPIISVFDWITSLRLHHLYFVFIDHLTSPAKIVQNDVQTALIPLLPQLRTWAVQHGLLDILAPAFQRTVAAWIDKVFKPQPSNDPTLAANLQNLTHWTCNCEPCVYMKHFLTRSTSTSINLFRACRYNEEHVRRFLASYARGLATITTPFSLAKGKRKPQELIVTKVPALHALTLWNVQKANGRAVLNSISSDDAELRRLLSTEYTRITSALQGRTPGPSLLPKSSAPGPAVLAHTEKKISSIPAGSSSQGTSTSVVPPALVNPAPAPPKAPQTAASVQPTHVAEARIETLPARAQRSSKKRKMDTSDPTPASLQETVQEPVLGSRPSKKRKMAPVNSSDVVDLS